MPLHPGIPRPDLAGEGAHLAEKEAASQHGHRHYQHQYPRQVRGEEEEIDGCGQQLHDRDYAVGQADADEVGHDADVLLQTADGVAAVKLVLAGPGAPEHPFEDAGADGVLRIDHDVALPVAGSHPADQLHQEHSDHDAHVDAQRLGGGAGGDVHHPLGYPYEHQRQGHQHYPQKGADRDLPGERALGPEQTGETRTEIPHLPAIPRLFRHRAILR